MRFDKSHASEWLLGLVIVLALVFLFNPFNFLMTSAFTLTLIMILAVVIIAFGVFVWREKPRDEREALYGLKAGRILYFVGGAVLGRGDYYAIDSAPAGHLASRDARGDGYCLASR